MANLRPLRPCNQPGCAAVVRPPAKYCSVHKHIEIEQEQARHRYYDQHLRDKQAEAFYKSKAWVAVRHRALTRDRYLCQECLKHGLITRANTVHHKVELKQDWSKRFRLDNLVSLCPECHNRAHGGKQID